MVAEKEKRKEKRKKERKKNVDRDGMEVRCRAHTSTYYLYMCMRVRHHFSEETILQKAAFRKIYYMVFGLSTLAFVSSFISPLSGHLRLSLSLFSSLSFFYICLCLCFSSSFFPCLLFFFFYFCLYLVVRDSVAGRLNIKDTRIRNGQPLSNAMTKRRGEEYRGETGKSSGEPRNRRISIDPIYRRCYRRRWLVQIVRVFRNTDTIRRGTTRYDTTRHDTTLRDSRLQAAW